MNCSFQQPINKIRAPVQVQQMSGTLNAFDATNTHPACTDCANYANYVYFWRTSEVPFGCFSNWYPSPFELNGVLYHTTEHYLMYQKALLMGDVKIGEAILNTNNAKKVKALGRRVKNFSEILWCQNREKIMYDGILAKCKAHPNIAETLLKTGDRTIVEASPYDRIWGVGISERDAKNGKKINGLNLLGKTLMRVRETLKAQNL